MLWLKKYLHIGAHITLQLQYGDFSTIKHEVLHDIWKLRAQIISIVYQNTDVIFEEKKNY